MNKFSFQNKLLCENSNFRALFGTAWSNYLCSNLKYAHMFWFENVNLKLKPLYYNKNHLCWDESHQSWYIFKKPPSRRARWCMWLFLCSRVENKIFVLRFSLAFKSSQSTFTHGKILLWQQRCACRRATFAGNGSVKRSSLLLCMKGAGNRNMHECSAQLANLSQTNTAGASQAISSSTPRFNLLV